VRAGVLFLILLVVGCTHVQSSGPPESRTEKSTRRSDMLCMQDCMGTQADKQLCEDRCSF
jgi:hypothetical protein